MRRNGAAPPAPSAAMVQIAIKIATRTQPSRMLKTNGVYVAAMKTKIVA